MPDPNALIDPNAPPDQEPEPQPEPQPAPPISIDQAYDVIAQAQGWDPRLTRYELDEIKRRKEELERERQELEAERAQRYQVPNDDGSDPYLKEMRETRRLIMEDRMEKQKEREYGALVNRLQGELHSSYVGIARQSGLTKEQMEAQSEAFYDALVELYPEAGMIQQVGAERAARTAFRLLGSGNGRLPAATPNYNPRDRRASIVIPGATGGGTQPVSGGLERPTRGPVETDEQWSRRVDQWTRAVSQRLREEGPGSLPKYASSE